MSGRQSRVSHNPHGMKPVNLGDIWEDLSSGIHHIYSRQSMPKKRYMGLYTYPFVRHPPMCVCFFLFFFKGNCIPSRNIIRTSLLGTGHVHHLN